MEETLTILESYLGKNKNHIIVTPNPEGVMQARRNPKLASAIKNADLSLADGTGIVLAAKLKRLKIPGRVRGYDTFVALCERLNTTHNFTAYFLGGQPGVAEKAKIKMEARYPNMKVVGHHHGYYECDYEIINEINTLSPDILLVCTGMPRAELWAAKNRNINARITMCLGGTLDIMAGEVKLTPSIFRKLGLEWLYRLLSNPKLRFKRQPHLHSLLPWWQARRGRKGKNKNGSPLP